MCPRCVQASAAVEQRTAMELRCGEIQADMTRGGTALRTALEHKELEVAEQEKAVSRLQRYQNCDPVVENVV